MDKEKIGEIQFEQPWKIEKLLIKQKKLKICIKFEIKISHSILISKYNDISDDDQTG